MIGFIFPGQGAQFPGMGKDIYEKYPYIKKLYARASEICKKDVASLCFEASEEELSLTINSQIAIFVTSIGYFEVLKQEKKIFPHLTGGLSLGEYTALYAADSIDFDTGVEIVLKRATIMHEVAEERGGTMASIIKASLDEVEKTCEDLRTSYNLSIWPANINSPSQIVVSGEEDAIKKIQEIGREKRWKVIPLKVSGAFHCPFMEKAAIILEKVLKNVTIKNPKIKFYCNVTGEKVERGEEIKNLLVKQLTSRVRWEEEFRNMVRDGAQRFLEVGPGKVLTGLGKKIIKTVEVIPINSIEGIKELDNDV